MDDPKRNPWLIAFIGYLVFLVLISAIDKVGQCA